VVHRLPRLAVSAVILFGALLTAPAVAAGGAAPSASSPVAAAATGGYLEGVDVSHWQNTISWSKVAAAGKSFAIIKATESIDYVDPLYATNRAGAQAAGMWTGAYHFARPSASAGDAVAEADHFADSVQLGSGDLIPALDIEVTGGLSPSALTAWVTAWLGQATARLGVKPMIYTSPAFWKKYLGDTRALADAGYKTLWIAHWGVSAPTVPAENWGGRGWTFWQYDNCGSVPGIGGCVDLDRYHGTDLRAQAVSGFSLNSEWGGYIKQGHVLATTIGISRSNFSDPVALAVSGLPKGSSALWEETPTTDSSTGLKIVTDAATTPRGTYPLTITGQSAGMTRTTSLSLVVTDGLPPTMGGPTARLWRYTQLGSTVPVRAFWTATDPSGVVSNALQWSSNGTSWHTIRLASPTATDGWTPVPANGTFRQRVRARDGADNRSAWKTGPAILSNVFQQNFSTVHYTGTWHGTRVTSASGGSLRYATSAGASASFTFLGSSVGWVSVRGPGRGTAKVYLDGVYSRTVDLREARNHLQNIVYAANWATSGVHTIKIVTTSSARVDVDAFVRLRVG
jgi:GH25 family lysozyme M1 (1,4-beta-N-acetylmuramidase)